jgi:hypothetical protein
MSTREKFRPEGKVKAAHREDKTMELRSPKPNNFHRSRPIVPCAQCGETLFAPEWSEYLDDRRIRHLWCCDACGYEFESMVCYPEPQAA